MGATERRQTAEVLSSDEQREKRVRPRADESVS